MTLAEVQSNLVLAKAAYAASLQGTEMQWEGRIIKLQKPDVYIQEINRLESIKNQLQSNRTGHNTSLADLSNPQ